LTTTILNNLFQLKSNIKNTAIKYNRSVDSVNLMIVTKGISIEQINTILIGGQQIFGESYLQEALYKIKILHAENIEWHFIGRIQSNKIKFIAKNFSWVDSVSNYQTAYLLNQYRSNNIERLNVCIQVNISNDPNKSGILIDNLLPFILSLTCLKNINIRGLMAIPTYYENFNEQYAKYMLLVEKFIQLRESGITLDTINIGMSHDYIAAIAAGATIIRIGKAIFKYNQII